MDLVFLFWLFSVEMLELCILWLWNGVQQVALDLIWIYEPVLVHLLFHWCPCRPFHILHQEISTSKWTWVPLVWSSFYFCVVEIYFTRTTKYLWGSFQSSWKNAHSLFPHRRLLKAQYFCDYFAVLQWISNIYSTNLICVFDFFRWYCWFFHHFEVIATLNPYDPDFCNSVVENRFFLQSFICCPHVSKPLLLLYFHHSTLSWMMAYNFLLQEFPPIVCAPNL